MAGRLARNLDRDLPDALEETVGGILRLRSGRFAAHDLDQRDEMRWIERMRDEDTLRPDATPLQIARHQGRCAAADQHIRVRDGIDVGQQRLLQRQPLRRILLNVVTAGDGIRQPVEIEQSIIGNLWDWCQLPQIVQGLTDHLAQPHFRATLRIMGPNLQALAQEIRRPCAADQPGTDDSHRAD
jgi:hypothetical protein